MSRIKLYTPAERRRATHRRSPVMEPFVERNRVERRGHGAPQRAFREVEAQVVAVVIAGSGSSNPKVAGSNPAGRARLEAISIDMWHGSEPGAPWARAELHSTLQGA